MPGQTPTYQNLGEGVKAYDTDWNNIAPSIGVNWTPERARDGWLRQVARQAGQRRSRPATAARYERHGMTDFTGVFDDNPGSDRPRGTRNAANGNLTVPLLLPQRRPRPAADLPAAAGAKPPAACSKRRSIR